MSVILRPLASHATINCTPMFTFGFKTLVRFVHKRFSLTDQQKRKKIYSEELKKALCVNAIVVVVVVAVVIIVLVYTNSHILIF